MLFAAVEDFNPFHHIQDEVGYWTIFHHLGGEHGLRIPLLNLRHIGIPFTMTKYMMLELIAAILIAAIFIPLARKIKNGEPPKGAWWNLFETFLTFIRDFVARPSLRGSHNHHGEHGDNGHGHGEHHHQDPDAEVDKYVPYLWTVFLFILFCNLLGMIPFMGSPTGHIWVTGALALCSFILLHGAATMKMGFVGYMKALWPAMDIPFVMAIIIKPMIFGIELLGTLIKCFVLAVRLFANLVAGHMVLAMILGFIVLANHVAVGYIGWGGITVASIAGVVALSLLELFVAFLQAFIFTFLTALFLGMAIHPQH